MLNASGVPHGTVILKDAGMHGGGFATGLDVALDGTMVSRNDTTTGYILDPGATAWRPLFIPGVTYSNADQVFKNPAQKTYEVCVAPSNSSILYASSGGFLWKSTDGGRNWTKLTGFKAGAIDTNMAAFGAERLGNQRMRVSPTDPNHVGFFHPVDGLYWSTNGGTTWTLSASVPAPTSVIGGNIHFVSDTEVWVVSRGNLVRRSPTGVGGTFSTVASGPSVCSAIASGNGKVYFIGDGQGGDTQLYMYDGTSFSQPAGVTGAGVDVRPADTTKVFAISAGGGDQYTSSNSGVNWTHTTNPYAIKQADDVPYLGRVSSAFLALGFCRYHPTLDRVIIANGIGVFYLDSPPGTGASKLVSITKGIRQMLPMDVRISPNGRTMVPVLDKAGFIFSRANILQQADNQIPDDTVTLRMGGGIDYARDNENYLAAVYTQGAAGSISTDGGKTWTAMPTIPTFTHITEGLRPFLGGNIAVSNAGNMLWVTTSNAGGGSTGGGVEYTLDGGVTWQSPVFGAGVNMTAAEWHSAYVIRRRIAQAYKGADGVFYLFCNGTGVGDAADIAMTGLWKSINGGPNFTKIRAGHFGSYAADFYQAKIKPNNFRAGHMCWIQGATNNYPTPPYAGGVWFTKDDWATEVQITGFSEPDDMDFGPKLSPSQLYDTPYFLAWHSGKYGTWLSTDFDPSSPNAATWVMQEEWLNGKPDNDSVIAADPTVPGRIVVGMSSGGIAEGNYVDTAHAT